MGLVGTTDIEEGEVPAVGATACADAINQVVPYVAVTNAGTSPGNYADALVHIKCESSVIAIVAAATPGLFASFNADNRLNAATGTVITTTFADGDRPETGGTPAARAADIDDLISQTVNIFSFDCTSDNRFNIDPLFDRSHNGMDKI